MYICSLYNKRIVSQTPLSFQTLKLNLTDDITLKVLNNIKVTKEQHINSYIKHIYYKN